MSFEPASSGLPTCVTVSHLFTFSPSHLPTFALPPDSTFAPQATPSEPQEIKIGYFGPDDPNHPTAGQMWLAATLAVEEANTAGGYNGLPFKLVPVWSENPWGTGVRDLMQRAYNEGLWAIVGAPDGHSAHLAAQVVAKAQLTFISAVSTDRTTHTANVPWLFSCAPGDHLLAPPLADAIVAQAANGPFAVVSCTDHDSRMFVKELLTALEKRRTFPSIHVHFQPQDTDFTRQLQSLHEANPAAVALIAAPRPAAACLLALRHEGLTMQVVGDARMGQTPFAEQARGTTGAVTYPLLWDGPGTNEQAAAFAQSFRNRFGRDPDYTAGYTFDAVNILIAAIHRAGLNRTLIRDAVRELSPFSGVTGTMKWDATGQNEAGVRISTCTIISSKKNGGK
ncbi:MAG: ABC transporter substrate-binding protein [Phycisphaerales bacterium]|nr:MAG: ABC transporter substrate-binding protein [Phycisphaerales bacterium]